MMIEAYITTDSKYLAHEYKNSLETGGGSMAYVGIKNWNRYKNIINKFRHDAFRNKLTWYHYLFSMNQFGENTDKNSKWEQREIKVLVMYDTIKNWPLNTDTTTGTFDEEHVVVYINLKYLKELGYTRGETEEDLAMDMDSVRDYFYLDGIKYRPSGDKPVAQAGDNPLLYRLILKRAEKENTEI